MYKSSFLQTAPSNCAEVQTETDVRTVTSEEPPSSRGICREREEEEERRGGGGGGGVRGGCSTVVSQDK